MLIGLMLRLLGEHRAAVWAIIVLQVVQTAGNLLLPTLNASIIDDGILANQPGVILGLGGWMLVLTAFQAAAALAAGAIRDATGHYTYAWLGAAAMCTIAAVVSATIRKDAGKREVVAVPA